MPSRRAAIFNAVAHQIAVAFFDDIAKMDTDPELDAPLGRQTGIALNQAALNFDGATDRVDDATELDKCPVAGSLDDPPAMNGNQWINEIAAKCA